MHVLDIGATKVLFGLSTRGGVQVRAQRDTPDNPAELAGWLGHRMPGRVASLGVAFPGGLDSEGRVSCWPNRPAWDGFDFGSVLNRLADKFVVRDDGEAAALGEARLGIGRGEPNVLVAVFGTGLGGAVILDHAIRRVPSGEPRTLGHLRILPSGVCACGGRGCAQLALRTLPPDDGLGAALSAWPDGVRLARFLADVARMLAIPTVVLTGGLLRRPVLRTQLVAKIIGEGTRALVPAEPGLSSLLGASVQEPAA